MKAVRWVIGRIITFISFLTLPKQGVRAPELQSKSNEKLKNYSLYQFAACPFCIKVKRHLRRLNLNMELHDAKNDHQHKETLLSGGGKLMVPCLKISDAQGKTQWMYESSDIINHLNNEFPLN